MNIESAIFTAIPAGRLENGMLAVTVFVTPRLAPDPGGLDLVPLTDFPAFGDWPRTVAESRWTFDVGGVPADGIPVARATGRPEVEPNPRVWAELFRRTSVGHASFQDYSTAVVNSYSVATVAAAVHDLYGTIAASSPTAFPAITRGPLKGLRDGLRLHGLERGTVLEHGRRQAVKLLLADRRTDSDPKGPGSPGGRFLRISDVPAAEAPAVTLAAAESFYDRTDDPWDETTAQARAPKPTPPEFHSFVARCADYPELLRHLGLAIDLAVEDDGRFGEYPWLRIAGVDGRDLLVQLAQPDEARPITRTHRTDRVWAPATGDQVADIVDGSLVIDRDRSFLVDQLDPDGAALKIASLLAQLDETDAALTESAEVNNQAPSMTDDASSLPALRSTGVIIARQDRAAHMVTQFDSAAGHESDHDTGKPALLSAADVTRGWRIDVQDRASGSDEWFSLHRRVGDYELVSRDAPPRPLEVQPGPDEGYLKAASMSSQGTAPTDDQYLHETLAGWDGWSLAVAKPGRILNSTGVVDPADGVDIADTGFPLSTRFHVQRGTLPRLRFGREYAFRVRAVDLSGQSIPPEQLDPAHERALGRTYQRWEPVPSPAVIPLTEYTEGESLMRMVIRSTKDVTVADYIALERVRTLSGHEESGDLGIVYRAQNERNLAAPIGSVQLAETHGMFDAALTGDASAVAAQFDTARREGGSYLTLPGGRVVNPHGDATKLTGSKEQLLPDGQYIVHLNRELPLPYLPDPLARGIALTTLPGDEGGSGGAAIGTPPARLVRWPGDAADWTDRKPILLRIVDGTGEPAFDLETRTLTVPVPKATLRTVKLSSFLDDADIELMRIWNLIADQAPPTTSQRDEVAQGRHWMITPWSELTLVHAVEKPLEAPVIELRPGVVRERDATFSLLPGVIRNHAASTGRLDVDAVWWDPVDDITSDGPTEAQKRAHVADFQIEAFEVEAQMWRSNGPAAGPYGPRHEVRHEFGDTRHRFVRYTPTATTRFREYFPPKITDRPELTTFAGPELRVNVPSSARPAPPDVNYAVPYWEWHTERIDMDAPLALRRVRSAGGLRVYLGRPWYSSGPGELLGVVLANQPIIHRRPAVEAMPTIDPALLGASEAWAQQVVRHAGIPGDPDRSALSVLDARIEAEVGDRGPAAPLRADRIQVDRAASDRGREQIDGFVRSAFDAVARARGADADLAAAERTRVVNGLVSEYISFFTGTGADGLRFTTAWGADPVFAGDPVPDGPYIANFPRAVAHGTVGLAEVPGMGGMVTVVGHRPEFDPVRRLWFCDIAIDAGTAYTPIVQLALARYQPDSIAGVEISPVVRADWLQPLPRRDASFVMTPDRGALLLSVAGAVGVPEHAIGLPDLASEVRASRSIEAWVERMPAGATSDLDWKQIGDPVQLDLRLGLRAIRDRRYAACEWTGAVPLPERAPGERVRVQLAEYEVHQGDDIGLSPIARILPVRGRRIVYGDSVELPE